MVVAKQPGTEARPQQLMSLIMTLQKIHQSYDKFFMFLQLLRLPGNRDIWSEFRIVLQNHLCPCDAVMAPSLHNFLASTRSALLSGTSGPKSLPISQTIVLGNPSADLDSFISAVVYAYFYSLSPQNESHKRKFVPLLDLPTTSSGELWRLRPEFGTALRLAQSSATEDNLGSDAKKNKEKSLLEQLVTIADVRSASEAPFYSLFSRGSTDAVTTTIKKPEVVLVDHNAISIPTLSTDDIASHVEIVGCIDHHVDESFVPSTASPRVIKTGIGSCTSLVVQHLRESKLWQTEDDQNALAEFSRLALAPILIDTANLTAEGKVSDTDRDAVAFLESCIRAPANVSESTGNAWDKDAFYNEISASKANSLDLLTLSEIFERDYKQWTETTSSGEHLKIGISSVVKPLTWLLEKSNGAAEFLREMHKFAQEPEQDLSLFAIMTTSTSADGDFQRELLVVASGSAATKALKRFKAKAVHELKLESWNEESQLVQTLKDEASSGDSSSQVWWQRALSKSRKQVAPLLRDMVKE